MTSRDFVLTKKSGTYADALAAFGLARLLYLLSGSHPVVHDDGPYYTVRWSDDTHDLERLDYQAVHADPGYRYMLLKQEDPQGKILTASQFIDYTRERERLKIWREQRDLLAKAQSGRPSADLEEQLKDIAPMKGWYLYQNINVLQGFNGYNALHTAIRESDKGEFALTVQAKLATLCEGRDPAAISTSFDPKVAAVQAFNPAVGKGTNRPKPDGAALSSLPGSFVDWFEEWLRYIGIHLCANALSLDDDIKLFVLAPAVLSESLCESIRDDFVSLRLPWSSAKIDILGALGLVRILITRSELVRSDTGSVLDFLLSDTPRDIVAGLHTAYFTSLGSARALTNIAFIGLPGWFSIGDADTWFAILDEHEHVIKALDEDHSEEAALLGNYRDFLSAGERGLTPLLVFLAHYATHYMRAQDRKQYAPPFTTTNLGRLIMSLGSEREKGSLAAILNNDGFKSIADAIRRATVGEQFYKARTGQQVYEIHYGLFQDLERKARFKEQFVAALSAFIADYNNENARIAERRARAGGDAGGRRRPQVTTDDLEHIMALIDQHGSELVAMLLVAYGSARKPRESIEATNGSEPATDGEATSEDLTEE